MVTRKKEKLANGNSSDSDAEDADKNEDFEEDEDAEEAQRAQYVPPQECKKSKHVWKSKDNEFDGGLPPSSGQWKVNIEGTDPINLFMHLFPEDLIVEMVLYALQKRERKPGHYKQRNEAVSRD